MSNFQQNTIIICDYIKPFFSVVDDQKKHNKKRKTMGEKTGNAIVLSRYRMKA